MHTAINCNGKSLSSSASPTVDAQPEPPSLPMPPPTLAAFTRTMPTAISAISAVSAMSPLTSSLYRPTIFGPRSRANQEDFCRRMGQIEYLRATVESYPRRLRSVIAAKKGRI
uniref:Uncharacterized protein n=2 Tax=Caenorhabditis japonica TaxID=281687 RepID=A0A8R1IDC9_CAEJA